MTYETLCEWVYGRYEIPYYQYELGLLRADGKPGFKSPTGRVELWSTVKQHLGEDPLPYYEEPRFSKRSRPEWTEKYPLDFVTGARRPTSFHTEHRMIDTLREIRTAATVEINPVTAEKHGIGQGDWVYVENPWGKCQMVADITPIVKEGVIGCDHGWWYPEDKDAELFDVRKSSINSLMPWKEIGKLGLGSHYGALPCKIYRTENCWKGGMDMATYGLMIDNEYCTGCHSCEIACRNELGLPLGQWGIKLLEMGPWRKIDGTWEGKYVPVPTTSCNLCEDRVAAGGEPSCALHCLANAIEYGTLEELAAKMSERGAQCSVFLP